MTAWLPVLKKGGLPCAGGKFDHCGFDPAKCKDHKRKLLGVAWSTCPVREAITDPAVGYVVDIEERAKIAPLTQRLVAWLWGAIAALREERTRAADQAERVREM